MYVDRDGNPRAQIALFKKKLFPLLASVGLSVLLHVQVPRGKSVRSLRIMEVGEKRNDPKAKWYTNKRRSKMNQNKTPDLRLRRRRGRVASEDNSNHPPFETKEMSCCRFRQRDCTYTWSNIHRFAWASQFWSPYETVAEKIRIPCSHAKKIRIRNLRFQKCHWGTFSKSSVWGPSIFKKRGLGDVRQGWFLNINATSSKISCAWRSAKMLPAPFYYKKERERMKDR